LKELIKNRVSFHAFILQGVAYRRQRIF